MSYIISAALTLYHLFVSPLLGTRLLVSGGCRFQPSCSAYGAAAVRQYGLGCGLVLLVRRLVRCHPWGGSGYDPLPNEVSGLQYQAHAWNNPNTQH